jgi:hypothetical protein
MIENNLDHPPGTDKIVDRMRSGQAGSSRMPRGGFGNAEPNQNLETGYFIVIVKLFYRLLDIFGENVFCSR